MNNIIPFPRKPRPVDAIAAIERLDSFGYPADTFPGNTEPTFAGINMASDLTVYYQIGEPRENNLRADGTPIVTTSVLEPA